MNETDRNTLTILKSQIGRIITDMAVLTNRTGADIGENNTPELAYTIEAVKTSLNEATRILESQYASLDEKTKGSPKVSRPEYEC